MFYVFTSSGVMLWYPHLFRSVLVPYGFCKKDFRAWSDCFFDGILTGRDGRFGKNFWMRADRWTKTDGEKSKVPGVVKKCRIE